ncbi:MAG: thioredoxin fold domain-containing protein [Spirochaetales bacterium]|nr:thioredoxin fold domain-containing protein [Spirochaetales bacterium]
MSFDTFSRLAFVLALAALGWLVYRVGIRARLQRLAACPTPGFQAGNPALVLFSSPDCVPCRTLQKPEIAHFQQDWVSKVQLIEIDVTERPDLARAWGVMSLPTTVVLDKRGTAQHFNPGIVRRSDLIRQFASLEKLS